MPVAFGLPKETVTTIMMRYKTTKVKVRSLDGDADSFDIVSAILQGNTYQFIICLDYLLRTSRDLMKENGFTLKKKTRNRRYPAQTITDADWADDIPLLANINNILKPNPSCIIWIRLEVVLADLTKYVCFNQKGDISTLNCGSPKLVKFTYFECTI